MYTIIIPTMWQSINCLTRMIDIYSKSKYVDEIIIINNEPNNINSIKTHVNKKIRIVTNNHNLFVNPSWNWGVELSKTDKIIIANDDIIIEDFEKLIMCIDAFLIPGIVIGPSYTCLEQSELPLSINLLKKNESDKLIPHENGWGWGIFMIMYKQSYKYIPTELLIWCGDVIQRNLNIPYEFTGVYIETKMSTTIRSKKLRDIALQDRKIFSGYCDQTGNLKEININQNFLETSNNSIKNELTIIIPAWKADKWINNCLESIYNNTWIKKNWNWEILIGIDCCDQTKYVIKSNLNLKVFFFKEHIGPYIIRNTLAYKEAKYSNLLYFDSDDTMEIDLIESCFKLNKPFITFQYNANLTSSGSSFVKKDLLFKYGGYQPWMCAADTDFIYRIIANGYEWSKLVGKDYMKRGIHKDQLTRAELTGRNSSLRNSYCLLMEENLKNKNYYVEPRFSEYEEIFENTQYMIITIVPKIKKSLHVIHKFKKRLKKLNIKNYNIIYLDIPNNLNYWQDEYNDNKIKQELTNLQIPTIIINNLIKNQMPIVYIDLNLEIFDILKLPNQYFDICFDLKKTNFHIYNYTEKSLRFLKIWEYFCQNIELSYLNYLDRFKLVIDLIENENKLIENKTIVNKIQLNIFNKKLNFKKNKNTITKKNKIKQSVAIPMGFPIPDSQKEKTVQKINKIKKSVRIKNIKEG